MTIATEHWFGKEHDSDYRHSLLVRSPSVSPIMSLTRVIRRSFVAVKFAATVFGHILCRRAYVHTTAPRKVRRDVTLATRLYGGTPPVGLNQFNKQLLRVATLFKQVKPLHSCLAALATQGEPVGVRLGIFCVRSLTVALLCPCSSRTPCYSSAHSRCTQSILFPKYTREPRSRETVFYHLNRRSLERV